MFSEIYAGFSLFRSLYCRAAEIVLEFAMSYPFLGRSAIIDSIKSKDRTNAMQKREGLTDHAVRFTVCGCPDPNCGGWHTIAADRMIPSCKNARPS
jgi:hypothetical protein